MGSEKLGVLMIGFLYFIIPVSTWHDIWNKIDFRIRGFVDLLNQWHYTLFGFSVYQKRYFFVQYIRMKQSKKWFFVLDFFVKCRKMLSLMQIWIKIKEKRKFYVKCKLILWQRQAFDIIWHWGIMWLTLSNIMRHVP